MFTKFKLCQAWNGDTKDFHALSSLLSQTKKKPADYSLLQTIFFEYL